MRRGLVALALLLAACVPGTPEPPRVACPSVTPPAVPADFRTTVVLETELGIIEIDVDGRAPNAAGSFIALVRCGAYDGTVFHRVVPGFVIQGGDIVYGRAPVDRPLVGSGAPGYLGPDDPRVGGYRRGTVGLARGGSADSGGSQFYIALDDASARDSLAAAGDTAILGEVIAGLEIVDRIAATAQDGSERNLALEPVTIIRARLLP